MPKDVFTNLMYKTLFNDFFFNNTLLISPFLIIFNVLLTKFDHPGVVELSHLYYFFKKLIFKIITYKKIPFILIW